MKSNFFKAVVVLVALSVILSGCIEESYSRNALTGGGGGSTINIVNNTFYGTMNQTPNMTPGSAATIAINWTFTGAPGTSALVSNVGTPSIASFDFTIPAGADGADGIMNQTPNMTMTFTGSTWYDHNQPSPDISGYQVFNRSYPYDGENTSSVQAMVPGTEYLIMAFATNSGDPGLNALPAGQRTWYTYADVSSHSGGNSYIVIRLYKRDTLGVETEMYNLTTQALSTTVSLDTTVQTTPYDIPMNVTDRFVAKYFGKTDSAANPTITLYYDGTTHISKATSPINQGVQGPPGPAGVNGTSAYVYGSPGEVLYNIGNNATTNPCMKFNNATGEFYSCLISGDGFNLTNISVTSASNANRLLLQVKEGGGSALKKGMAVYVSGGTIGLPYVRNASNANSATSRVIGLVYADINLNAAGQVVRYGTLDNVDTRPTNLAINPNGETWAAGDLLFLADSVGGGMTNVRPTSGRSVKAAYALSPSSAAGSLLAYPMENPVWVTAAQSEDVVLRVGDNIGASKVSIRNYSNTEVASFNSYGNLSARAANNITIISNPSDATNKSYVDAAIAAIPGGSGDTSGFAFINGTRPFTRVNVSTPGNVSGITTIIGMDDAVNKSWVSMGGCPRCFADPIVSDFWSGSTGAIPGLLGVAISSGSVAGVATDSTHPGVIYMRDSTTAAGGYRFGCDGTQLLSGGEYFEVIFQSVGTRQTQYARMGWQDSTAGATLPTDGVYFNITRTPSNLITNLTGMTANSGSRSITSSNYSLAASTWYRGTIQVNSAATRVDYTLYDSSNNVIWLGNTTGTIPTAAGRDTSPCLIVSETSTDAAADILRLDYVRWTDVKARVR